MNTSAAQKASEILNISKNQIEAVDFLLQEGSTIAFIARYRKEKTGSLDEVEISLVKDTLEQIRTLEKRKEAVLSSLEEQNVLTPELEKKVINSKTLPELEDIYLPFRPKKRTKASIAKEKGLLGLAEKILLQVEGFDPLKEAKNFVDPEKGVNSEDEAIEGAKFIIAEIVSENSDLRGKIREIFNKESVLKAKLVKSKQEEAQKFKDYFDYEEEITKLPGHRLLAVLRGHSLGFLSISIRPDDSKPLQILKKQYLRNAESSFLVNEAIEDSYKRLILPSMETEIKNSLKEKADLEAIEVFASNLKELLMASPLGRKKILAVDPGLRTGCKTVVLDDKGDLKEDFIIFPFEKNREEQAKKLVINAVEKYRIEAVAVGNGTGGRESEAFLKSLDLKIPVILTDESGASVYSASETAREEFPDHDLTVRGAVSIGRRLMDPLAELVKIDPKSIGVGQYQHDVDQKLLKSKLDNVVISCVNQVGVDLNLASRELLSYVSGLGPKMAKAIVDYRTENKRFDSRKELKKVPKLGPKTFEQCAGFLRISDGENPLDSSAVHPESYKTVEKMAKDLSCKVIDLIKDKNLRDKIDLNLYVTEDTGLPTLKDIINELAKPGRDPRKDFEVFSFRDGVNSISDLEENMTLPGIVTNVTKFGAFVDIGVHQDGLVHISEMADRFIKDPSEVVKVKQKVMVKVISVDEKRKRISLSMKTGNITNN
ncbi:MAG: RNA-binding transcriptional accessory protein [Desulfobacteraceae bacterium]|nr:RNA-binding transcriptional accessory protein [Desulfobacteraceae bacterium]